jgi:DNA invertase Pin-like site-specific DNA recombinase
MSMSRVAIYARVSTDDRGQDPENQLAQLRAWCAAAGHTIAGEYIDHVSGGKGTDERPGLARMLDDAYRRKFDVLLCWALDRLSREGLEATIGYLRRLGNAGVSFHSYSEPMLSTDNMVVRDVLLAVMASMASMERARISQRTKAGLARVREQGTKLGRRPIADTQQAEIATLAGEGLTAYAIGKRLGVDIKTVQKYAAR